MPPIIGKNSSPGQIDYTTLAALFRGELGGTKASVFLRSKPGTAGVQLRLSADRLSIALSALFTCRARFLRRLPYSFWWRAHPGWRRQRPALEMVNRCSELLGDSMKTLSSFRSSVWFAEFATYPVHSSGWSREQRTETEHGLNYACRRLRPEVCSANVGNFFGRQHHRNSFVS